LLHGDTNELNEKLMECNLIKNFKHPNICKFESYFVTGKVLCILNEFCDKGDLEIYIKNQNGLPISESRIKKFILEILLAINFLHNYDIIHRDLKPSNLFLKGKDYQINIGDFGEAAGCG